jgi:hypothetical protein
LHLWQIDRLRLLEAIDRHFDGEELRTLCFELEVDYDSLPARGKINKARELIKYCERSRRLDRLVDLCRQYLHVEQGGKWCLQMIQSPTF